MNAQILTVSSKGQISIPIETRKQLSISTGDKIVAYVVGDSIVLKTLKVPEIEEFRKACKEVQDKASISNFSEADMLEIIKDYRSKHGR